MKAVRILALSAASIAAALVAAEVQAGDSHRQPGPSHRHALPIEAAAIASSPHGPAVKPTHPPTVTAVHGPTMPGGGDPRIQINSQPVPPGHSRASSRATTK